LADETDIERIATDRHGRATIRLASHATAGYRWQLAHPGDGLVVERHEVKPGEAFGAVAEESFEVRLTGNEPVDVMLVLKRPWEEDPVEVRRVTVGAGRDEEKPGRR